MQQVPQYLIIGNGRVSRHFQHYFSLINLPFKLWHRKESFEQLNSLLDDASHILILINDNAIDDFIIKHLKNSQVKCIHFSGSLNSEYAYSAHPLMTFNQQLYSLDDYLKIPFIIDDDAPEFETLLPGLANSHRRLQKSLKGKYHALCVLSGNFSCMLWQKLFRGFEEFNFPAEFVHPYLLQQTKNLMSNPKTALTGPLIRNDQLTIKKNLAALNTDPFKEVYEAFVICYQKEKELDK